jgi:4-amino-4-deoxy-L-arabinose transferase-like glycosyltransferase
MSAVRSLLRRPETKWLVAIVVVAFVVRLAVATLITPDPRDGRYDDTVWYDTTARHLAAGHGYVFDPTVWVTATGERIYPDENALTPTALWPPGYPITLAVIYKLTGDSLDAARLANVVFGTLTAGLVFLIARRLFDLRAAVLAGFALALLPSHVLFTSVLLSETFFGMLLALILCVCVYFVFDGRPPDGRKVALVLGLGVLVAATGQVRGEFAAFGLVLALIMVFQWRQRALLPLAAFALGAALVITPWALRNRSSMGETIVGTTGAGRVLYQGHNPLADGQPSLRAFWELQEPYTDEDLSLKEVELRANRDGTRLAREYAWDHKLDELRLVGLRMFNLFRTDESGVTWIQSNQQWFGEENANKLIQLSSFAFFTLIAFSLASLPAWWRWRDPRRWAVFAVAPYYMLIFGVLFIGDPRYHYAMYVPLAVFGAAGVSAALGVTAAAWRDVFGDRSFGQLLRTYGTPPP